MTVRCPNGHESERPDYCDECGTALEPTPAVSDVTRVTRTTRCPVCNQVVQPGDRFCEACGHDVTAPPPTTRWVATVTADPDFHAAHTGDEIAFPAEPAPARVVELEHDEVSIGRADDAGIDLSIEPVDPAVSRVHACLRRQADGAYAVVDLGSANGTWVNDDQRRIDARVPVVLQSGDRIHVGGFTTIIVERVDADPTGLSSG